VVDAVAQRLGNGLERAVDDLGLGGLTVLDDEGDLHGGGFLVGSE
jgi:hypothetical protein